MSRWGGTWGGWYPRRTPRAAPAHGVKVRKVGATWWGRQWVLALEAMSHSYSNRLGRGLAYARGGRVHDLEIEGGSVRAQVTGSRVYRVTLEIAPLPAAAWDRAVDAMASQAVFAAKLLAGQMPETIGEAFAAAGTTLFPAAAADLRTSCSCPDAANPCKHVAAVHYVLGEAFDADPFLLFELRGRSRAQVLGTLRRARADDCDVSADPDPAVASFDGRPAARRAAPRRRRTSEPTEARAPDVPDHDVADAVPFELASPDDYERPRADLTALRFGLEPPPGHAAAVRALGDPPGWSLDAPLPELLAPVYEAASGFARRLAEPVPADASDPASDGAAPDGVTRGLP